MKVGEVRGDLWISNEVKRISALLQPPSSSVLVDVYAIEKDILTCVTQIRDAILSRYDSDPEYILSKKQRQQIRRISEDGRVLLYYQYADLHDAEIVRNWQYELCLATGLSGRIHVATEV